MIATWPAPGDPRPNPDWASLPIFDRRGWKRVRFGDVVENLNETERDPAGADIEHFIGLEHLEPGSLHIRTRGNVADGTTFTRRCRPGQVLFGKRRAYQRKVAVAEFDAVVSGDIYVFAPKDDRLMPELLPFICLSERFFEYAVETSAGSLSPRTNWKHLAEFEFDLPPLDQQRRIAEMLWAVDEVQQRSLDLIPMLSTTAESIRQQHFDSALKNYSSVKLSKVGHWSSGKTPSRERRDFWSGDFPWVSPKDMKTDLISSSEERVSEKGREASVTVDAGALLIVVRGMILAHSFPIAITRRPVAFNQDIKALAPSKEFSVEYLFNWFKWATPAILGRISDSSHGTKRLSMDNLFDMRVPRVPLTEQSLFVEQINRVQGGISTIYQSIEMLAKIQRTILNSIIVS